MISRPRIDRFEGELAVVVLDGRSFDLPRTLLPEDAREGDVLLAQFTIDPESSASAREATAAKRARLSRDDDGGDFSL